MLAQSKVKTEMRELVTSTNNLNAPVPKQAICITENSADEAIGKQPVALIGNAYFYLILSGWLWTENSEAYNY